MERSVGKKSLRKAEVRKAVGRLHAKHSSVLRCTEMNYRSTDTNTNTHKHANVYTYTYCNVEIGMKNLVTVLCNIMHLTFNMRRQIGKVDLDLEISKLLKQHLIFRL